MTVFIKESCCQTSTNRTTGLISVSIFRLVDDVMQPGLHVCQSCGNSVNV